MFMHFDNECWILCISVILNENKLITIFFVIVCLYVCCVMLKEF